MIKDIRDVLQTDNVGRVKNYLRIAQKKMPTESDAEMIIPAEVNHNRWIVRCPFCKGAEMIDKNDLRFYCLSCHNEKNGGKWIPIAMPNTASKIETELNKRPMDRNKNWVPGETLKNLQNENARMKAGGIK